MALTLPRATLPIAAVVAAPSSRTAAIATVSTKKKSSALSSRGCSSSSRRRRSPPHPPAQLQSLATSPRSVVTRVPNHHAALSPKLLPSPPCSPATAPRRPLPIPTISCPTRPPPPPPPPHLPPPPPSSTPPTTPTSSSRPPASTPSRSPSTSISPPTTPSTPTTRISVPRPTTSSSSRRAKLQVRSGAERQEARREGADRKHLPPAPPHTFSFFAPPPLCSHM